MDAFTTELVNALQNTIPLFMAYSVVPAWVATILIPLFIVVIRHGFKNVSMFARSNTAETVVIHQIVHHNHNEYFSALSHYLVHTAKIRVTISMARSQATGDKSQILSEAMEKQSFVYDGCRITICSSAVEREVSGVDRMIQMQSRSKEVMLKLLAYALEQYKSFKNSGSIGDHHHNDALAWNTSPMYVSKTFDNIYLDPKLRTHILKEIDSFIESEQFYKQHGIAYRRGFLMHGSPGCGKTSVINAIANRTGFEIRSLHLTKVKDGGMLRRIARGIPPSSIVVLEDLDCLSVTHKRCNIKITEEAAEHMAKHFREGTAPLISDVSPGSGGLLIANTLASYHLLAPESRLRVLEVAAEKDPAVIEAFVSDLGLNEAIPGGYREIESKTEGSLLLSDLLDLLDSNTFLYKTIVIITSNRPEKFDPALIRPGRIDTKFEFLPADEPLVHQILKSFYPEMSVENLPRIKTPIAQSKLINSIIIPNRKSYEAALVALNRT